MNDWIAVVVEETIDADSHLLIYFFPQELQCLEKNQNRTVI